jgi:hypothetical protein
LLALSAAVVNSSAGAGCAFLGFIIGRVCCRLLLARVSIIAFCFQVGLALRTAPSILFSHKTIRTRPHATIPVPVDSVNYIAGLDAQRADRCRHPAF